MPTYRAAVAALLEDCIEQLGSLPNPARTRESYWWSGPINWLFRIM